MKFLRPLFYKKHGTERGYVRHILALCDYYLGRIEDYKSIEHTRVKRVVFVCLGNICRSSYAHHYAKANELGRPIASLGLSTTTGVGANDVAIAVAKNNNIDMNPHKATDLTDFEVMEGDLFLVMEIRQANRLRAQLPNVKDVQIGLLGNYCQPVHPHLHDPYLLSQEYFEHCFRLVEDAVQNLKTQLKK